MKIIASYSIKGGVGKTATAVNLAMAAAQKDNRTLLIDLDPQGASSFYFRVKPSNKLKTRRFFNTGEKLMNHVRGSDFANLDVLPANLSYRKFDLTLNQESSNRKALKKILKAVAEDYDLVVLDCPPGLSLLAEHVFEAAEQILVPVIPTPLSERTLSQLYDFFKDKGLPKRKIQPFLSMVDRRTSLQREHCEALRKKYSNLARAFIPLSAEIEKMGIRRAPVLSYAPRHVASDSYRSLWQEITPSMKKRRKR